MIKGRKRRKEPVTLETSSSASESQGPTDSALFKGFEFSVASAAASLVALQEDINKHEKSQLKASEEKQTNKNDQNN